MIINFNPNAVRTKTRGHTSGFLDVDAQFIISSLVSKGTSVHLPHKAAINGFVKSGKANGWWDKCVGIYGLYGDTADSHAVNWKTPGCYDIAWSGTVNHDNAPNAGISSGGGYGDTGIIPSEHFSTSSHVSALVEGNTVAQETLIGCYNNNAGRHEIGRYNSEIQSWASTWTAQRVWIVNPGAPKWLLANREDNLSHELYSDGIEGGSIERQAQNPTVSLYVLASNKDGIAEKFASNLRCSFFSVGFGLTAAQRTQMNNAVFSLRAAIRQ